MLQVGETGAGRAVPGRGGFLSLILVVMAFALSACSEEALGQLGGRSSDWIGEVATTATTTTTTTPAVTRSSEDAEWINVEFGPPDPDAEPNAVLAEVFDRSGPASRYLQASPGEIVAVAPDVQFPGLVPTNVSFVTSQVVIESRELTLADNPTVAFGLWSVEPYSRSRSVGQLAVLNVSRDPGGVEAASGGDPEAVCTAIVTGDRVCSSESFTDFPVWRLEDAGGVVHVWFSDPFRYELDGFASVDEEVVHQVVASVVPLTDLTLGP